MPVAPAIARRRRIALRGTVLIGCASVGRGRGSLSLCRRLPLCDEDDAMSNRPFTSWASRRPAWVANGLPAVALAVALVGARMFEAGGLHRSAWAGYVLPVMAALAVAGRRRWPLAVFAGTLALAVSAIAVASP